VRRECERERDAAGRPFLEGKHAVRSDAREQGASLHSTEYSANETGRGLPRPEAKASERERVPRPAQRTEHGFGNLRPGFHERFEELPIRRLIPNQLLARALYRTVEARCRTCVERMGQHDRRSYPLEAILAQRKRLKNGETTANGCTAEQISCTKPGSVSSADWQPLPTLSAASKTMTFRPVRAIAIAAASPFGPEPTITASTCPYDVHRCCFTG
jgi:hypothetical protein